MLFWNLSFIPMLRNRQVSKLGVSLVWTSLVQCTVLIIFLINRIHIFTFVTCSTLHMYFVNMQNADVILIVLCYFVVANLFKWCFDTEKLRKHCTFKSKSFTFQNKLVSKEARTNLCKKEECKSSQNRVIISSTILHMKMCILRLATS